MARSATVAIGAGGGGATGRATALALAVAHVPEVGGRDVELGPRRPDHAGGRLERPEEGASDRQLDRDNG